MQPRQQFYNFAHRALKDDAHTKQELWSFITGDKADSYAQMRWHEAGEAAGENHPPEKLLWVAPIKKNDIEIMMLHMPAPQNPTEAYYAAFVKNPKQQFPLRYFVAERNSDGGATWAELRPNMRIRGEALQEWPADPAKRSELPQPYAATFVDAIVTEVTAFPNVVDNMPSLSDVLSGSKKPAPKTQSKNNLALIIIGVSILLVAILVLATR